MDVVTGGPRVGGVNIAWWMFAGSCSLLIASAVLWLISISLFPGIWMSFSGGTAIAVAAGAVLTVSWFFLLFGGNRQFAGMGRGWGEFYGRYFRMAPKWVVAISIALAIAGVALSSYAYSTVAVEIERVDGHFVEDSGAGPRVVPEARYTQWLLVKMEILPIGMAFLLLDWNLVALVGDRVQRSETSALAASNAA